MWRGTREIKVNRNGTRKELEEGKGRGSWKLFIEPRKIKPYRYMPEDSPEVIEPYTPSGYIIWWGLQSSSLYFSFPSIIRYKYLACRLDSPRCRPKIRSPFALYSSFHSRSRRAARANDKLCTRICIFDTWLQRPGRSALALSYVTGPGRALCSEPRLALSLSSSFSRLIFFYLFP